jgi:hypothetical protein
MKAKISYLLLGLGLLFTLSCTKYPPSSERLLEDLAVLTQYDTKVKFNDYKTYSIAPAILKITDKDTINMTGTTAQAVLDQIKKDMDSRGFVQVAQAATPDFGIQVFYYQNTTVYAYYGGYWGYDYWGYYYPYYPVYYSSYTTGALTIDLVDLKYPNTANHKLYARWNGFIRGLLTGSHTQAEITNSVHQAFVQTPELKTTANQ